MSEATVEPLLFCNMCFNTSSLALYLKDPTVLIASGSLLTVTFNGNICADCWTEVLNRIKIKVINHVMRSV